MYYIRPSSNNIMVWKLGLGCRVWELQERVVRPRLLFTWCESCTASWKSAEQSSYIPLLLHCVTLLSGPVRFLTVCHALKSAETTPPPPPPPPPEQNHWGLILHPAHLFLVNSKGWNAFFHSYVPWGSLYFARNLKRNFADKFTSLKSMLAFFLDISRSEISESYHTSMLYILRNTQVISKMAVPFFSVIRNVWNFPTYIVGRNINWCNN